ncbi:MAG TPA: DMT family transporter [Thermodesulfobacteriota bacterium]|jgi:drug/metabolite transporter (DMT)-like permease|nr:DMT family transporter [Thermodesulfobacteriota bacterium]
MKPDRERQGESFILLQALLWSLFPVITILSYGLLPPLISFGWSTLFATLFFGGVLTLRHRWGEIRDRSSLRNILWATLFLGILYYGLVFFGLRYTSAGNASLIAATEMFFSFIFFHIWRRDFISPKHILGAIFMLIGVFIVLYPNTTKLHLGDLLILMATVIAPFGNYFQQRARERVSSEMILFVRSAISTPIVLLSACLLREKFSITNLKTSADLILINGLLLMGFSKILWVEGIHRISVTKSNALASIAPPLTLLFAWLILHNIPTRFQLLSVVPILFGVALLSMNKRPADTVDI